MREEEVKHPKFVENSPWFRKALISILIQFFSFDIHEEGGEEGVKSKFMSKINMTIKMVRFKINKFLFRNRFSFLNPSDEIRSKGRGRG